MAMQNNIHIGDTYERLTVISEPYQIDKRWFVDCQCLCGNLKLKTRIDGLYNKKIRSCGCLAKENGIKQGKSHKRYNTYEFKDDYGIGYTNNTNQYGENFFYFDIEDYDLIKEYCWCFDKDGYLFSMPNRKNLKMHRLIMGNPIGKEIDHRYYTIDGKSTKNDNRKDNLKICTHKENCKNRIDKNTGIIETREGFVAYKGNKYLGIFNTYEDAIIAKNIAK